MNHASKSIEPDGSHDDGADVSGASSNDDAQSTGESGGVRETIEVAAKLYIRSARKSRERDQSTQTR